MKDNLVVIWSVKKQKMILSPQNPLPVYSTWGPVRNVLDDYVGKFLNSWCICKYMADKVYL